MAKRVIIDTDPGIDDALALLLALQSPEIEVAAITTVSGNVPVETGTLNVFRILSLLPSIPIPVVARGASRPLTKDPAFGTHIHGEDGLGGLHRFKNEDGSLRHPIPAMDISNRSATDEILHQLSRSTIPTTLIPLGPLTNVAMAIEKDRDRMASLKEIVLMGGNVEAPGNVTSVAEFNIYYDPHAAEIVFNSGIPITMVGLDVTRRVKFYRQDIDTAGNSRQGGTEQFVSDISEALFGFLETRTGEPGYSLHDPLAVAVAIDPSLVTKQEMRVEIETQGRWTQGMTVADRRPLRPEWKEPPNVHVCADVDETRFRSLFLERVLRTC